MLSPIVNSKATAVAAELSRRLHVPSGRSSRRCASSRVMTSRRSASSLHSNNIHSSSGVHHSTMIPHSPKSLHLPGQRLRYVSSAPDSNATTDSNATAGSPSSHRMKVTVKYNSPNKVNHSNPNNNNHNSNPWSGVSQEKLLEETNRLRRHLRQKPDPNTKTVIRLDDYFHVLEAWMEHAKASASTNTNNIQAAQQARVLLEAMEQETASEQRHNNPNGSVLAPTMSFYEVVLQAYATCQGGEAAALEAETILAFLLEQQNQRRRRKRQWRLQPTTKTFNIVLNCWAKSQTRDAGRCAHQIYEHMLQRAKIHRSYAPNERTIVTLMDAWNKSGHYNARKYVLALFQTTFDNWITYHNAADAAGDLEGVPVIPLDIAMFHAAMDVIVKSSQRSKFQLNNNNDYQDAAHQGDDNHLRNMTPTEAAEHVEGMLAGLLEHASAWKVHPNVRTFAIVLDAWAQAELRSTGNHRGYAAQRAQTILQLLLEAYYGDDGDKHLSPALAQSPVKPNEVTFTTVITAWSHAKQAQKAHDAFQQLLDLYYASGREDDLVPTIVTGNAVMAAWAREKRTDFILQTLQTMSELADETGRADCQPDLRSFNILLGAYGKTGHLQEATALLQWMEDGGKGDKQSSQSTHSGVPWKRPDRWEAPDVVSYNCVLAALGQQGEATKAETLLISMKQKGIEPDQFAYTSMMSAYVRSQDKTKVAKGTLLLQELSAKTKPDAICLVAYMQLCASAGKEERRMAFARVLEAFETLPPAKINHVTFSIMAQALNRLLVWDSTEAAGEDAAKFWESEESLTEEKMRLMQMLCVQCCEAGYFSDRVHQELQRAGSNVLHWLKSNRFQPEWSQNVPMHQRPQALLRQQKFRQR